MINFLCYIKVKDALDLSEVPLHMSESLLEEMLFYSDARVSMLNLAAEATHFKCEAGKQESRIVAIYGEFLVKTIFSICYNLNHSQHRDLFTDHQDLL